MKEIGHESSVRVMWVEGLVFALRYVCSALRLSRQLQPGREKKKRQKLAKIGPESSVRAMWVEAVGFAPKNVCSSLRSSRQPQTDREEK